MKISKKWIDIAGKILMVLSILFITYKLMQYNIDLSYINNFYIFILFGFVLLHGANIYIFAPKSYSLLINLISYKQVPYALVRYIYCKSNLYKYLPGNIMHFIGRNQIAVNANISHADIAVATIIEMIMLVTASLLIILLTSSVQVFELVLLYKNEYVLHILIILVLVIMFTLYIIRKKIINKIKQYKVILTKNGIRVLLIVLFYSVIRLSINALIFIGCLSVFINEIPFNDFWNIFGIFIMTWVVGFLIPGAPGGIGVREAAMCLAFGYLYSDDKILYTALIYRVISIFGDMMSYIYVLVNKNIEKKFNKI